MPHIGHANGIYYGISSTRTGPELGVLRLFDQASPLTFIGAHIPIFAGYLYNGITKQGKVKEKNIRAKAWFAFENPAQR